MHYVHTSALVKLIVAEEFADAMRAWTLADRITVTSDLTRTELMRAVSRVHPERARHSWAPCSTPSPPWGSPARCWMRPGASRRLPCARLDAIHLAAALAFGDELESFVTYDDRLALAATGAGLRVEAPGR